MTKQEYIQNKTDQIDSLIKRYKQNNSTMSFGHNILTTITGVLGFWALFGQPLLGVGLIAGAVALELNRRTLKCNTYNTIKYLNEQKEYLNKAINTDLDTSQTAMQDRRSKITRLDGINNKRQKELKTGKTKNLIGNIVAASGVVLAGLISSPIVAIPTIACIGAKYLLDRNYRYNHESYQKSNLALSNTVHEYNIGQITRRNANGGNNGQPNVNPQSHTNSNARTNSQGQRTQNNTGAYQVISDGINQVRSGIHDIIRDVREDCCNAVDRLTGRCREDEEVVDEYLRNMGTGDQQTNRGPVLRRRRK